MGVNLMLKQLTQTDACKQRIYFQIESNNLENKNKKVSSLTKCKKQNRKQAFSNDNLCTTYVQMENKYYISTAAIHG